MIRAADAMVFVRYQVRLVSGLQAISYGFANGWMASQGTQFG